MEAFPAITTLLLFCTVLLTNDICYIFRGKTDMVRLGAVETGGIELSV